MPKIDLDRVSLAAYNAAINDDGADLAMDTIRETVRIPLGQYYELALPTAFGGVGDYEYYIRGDLPPGWRGELGEVAQPSIGGFCGVQGTWELKFGVSDGLSQTVSFTLRVEVFEAALEELDLRILDDGSPLVAGGTIGLTAVLQQLVGLLGSEFPAVTAEWETTSGTIVQTGLRGAQLTFPAAAGTLTVSVQAVQNNELFSASREITFAASEEEFSLKIVGATPIKADGEEIRLRADLTRTNVPGAVTYQWSASEGTFGTPTAQRTTFDADLGAAIRAVEVTCTATVGTRTASASVSIIVQKTGALESFVPESAGARSGTTLASAALVDGRVGWQYRLGGAGGTVSERLELWEFAEGVAGITSSGDPFQGTYITNLEFRDITGFGNTNGRWLNWQTINTFSGGAASAPPQPEVLTSAGEITVLNATQNNPVVYHPTGVPVYQTATPSSRETGPFTISQEIVNGVEYQVYLRATVDFIPLLSKPTTIVVGQENRRLITPLPPLVTLGQRRVAIVQAPIIIQNQQGWQIEVEISGVRTIHSFENSQTFAVLSGATVVPPPYAVTSSLLPGPPVRVRRLGTGGFARSLWSAETVPTFYTNNRVATPPAPTVILHPGLAAEVRRPLTTTGGSMWNWRRRETSTLPWITSTNLSVGSQFVHATFGRMMEFQVRLLPADVRFLASNWSPSTIVTIPA